MVSPRRGLAVFAASIESMAASAESADAAGFDSVWTSELYNRSATITLAAIAQRTTTCTIGSGIVYGVGRSPLMLAAEARDLDELSGGRFVLGIGNGTRRMISDWHGLDGAAPALRMEELVGLLRRIWRLHEGPIDHEGRFYRLRIRALDAMTAEAPREIPIYTAGVNPRMIESAGRVADGLLGHTLFTPGYIANVVQPALEKGARRCDRDVRDVGLTTLVMASAHADEEAARKECRKMIAFYGSVKSYGAIYAHEGFGREAVAMQETFRGGDINAMVGAVSDAMVDRFAVAGTPAQVAAGLERFRGVADEIVLYPPSFQVEAERVAENVALLTEHCAAPGVEAP
jgi:probable F420-dependent oxidoreductase